MILQRAAAAFALGGLVHEATHAIPALVEAALGNDLVVRLAAETALRELQSLAITAELILETREGIESPGSVVS